MSLSLDFEPHSWYMHFAIKHNGDEAEARELGLSPKMLHHDNDKWQAFTDDGNTYQIIELSSSTLKQLKFDIREYYIRRSGGNMNKVPARLVNALALHTVRTKIPF